MSISVNLTQQKLQEILLHSYLKGQEEENLKTEELLEEIKDLLLLQTETGALSRETIV